MGTDTAITYAPGQPVAWEESPRHWALASYHDPRGWVMYGRGEADWEEDRRLHREARSLGLGGEEEAAYVAARFLGIVADGVLQTTAASAVRAIDGAPYPVSELGRRVEVTTMEFAGLDGLEITEEAVTREGVITAVSGTAGSGALHVTTDSAGLSYVGIGDRAGKLRDVSWRYLD